MVKVSKLRFDIVDGLRVNEAQTYIADAAIAKGCIDLLDRSGDKHSHVEHVAARGLARVENHQVYGDFLGFQCCSLSIREGCYPPRLLAPARACGENVGWIVG